METILFGPTPISVSPEKLKAMTPHQRAEYLALIRESGKSADTISRVLGIGRAVFERIVSTRYDYRIPVEGEERMAPEAIPAEMLERVDISRNALRLLRRIVAERNGLQVGRQRLVMETGITEKALDRAVADLEERGLMVRLGNPGPGKPRAMHATPQGRALLLQASGTMIGERCD